MASNQEQYRALHNMCALQKETAASWCEGAWLGLSPHCWSCYSSIYTVCKHREWGTALSLRNAHSGYTLESFGMLWTTGEQLLRRALNDRTRGNGFEPKEGRFGFKVRKKFLYFEGGKELKQVYQSPISGSIEGLFGWGFGATWSSRRCPCPRQECWDSMIFNLCKPKAFYDSKFIVLMSPHLFVCVCVCMDRWTSWGLSKNFRSPCPSVILLCLELAGFLRPK